MVCSAAVYGASCTSLSHSHWSETPHGMMGGCVFDLRFMLWFICVLCFTWLQELFPEQVCIQQHSSKLIVREPCYWTVFCLNRMQGFLWLSVKMEGSWNGSYLTAAFSRCTLLLPPAPDHFQGRKFQMSLLALEYLTVLYMERNCWTAFNLLILLYKLLRPVKVIFHSILNGLDRFCSL